MLCELCVCVCVCVCVCFVAQRHNCRGRGKRGREIRKGDRVLECAESQAGSSCRKEGEEQRAKVEKVRRPEGEGEGEGARAGAILVIFRL